MEVEEKSLPIVDSTDESNTKKGKILTLLFPAELQSTDGKEVKKDKNKPPTKVVIRRLPPKLTKEVFLEEFSPLPAHDYFHFVRGDLNLGTNAFSRAYINFLNQEDIFSFKEKFDDYDIQDERGKIYHTVVEFAPFQKIPRRNVIKRKLSKVGTLESDPKYIEFLQKLEESKNYINNPSEYFHETESSASKTKVVTTPLLEFLKKKKQKKIDLKNEIRQRKREVEKEKRRREEEKKKAERERKKEEKKTTGKNKIIEEKGKKIEIREKCWVKDDKKDFKNQENQENESTAGEKLNTIIPNDPAILEVVVRQTLTDKDGKSGINEDTKYVKSTENDTNIGKADRKYSDFRSRPIEEKQRKSFYKREIEDFKLIKGNRKGVPDEKGDNYSIGTCADTKDSWKKPFETESRRHDYKMEVKETKSKFRYSEQRNRDREYRQKTSDCKTSKDTQRTSSEPIDKTKDTEEKEIVQVSNINEEEKKQNIEIKETQKHKSGSVTTDTISLPSRRKSLELERKIVDSERKRSKSFHDVSGKEYLKFNDNIKRQNSNDRSESENTAENLSGLGDENSRECTEMEKADEDHKKDRRLEKRIRNKDRPSLEIYRPGMGKFSKQRLSEKKEDGNGTSTVSTPHSTKSSSFINKNSKKSVMKSESKTEETKNSEESGKDRNEVKTMTFIRSLSKEN